MDETQTRSLFQRDSVFDGESIPYLRPYTRFFTRTVPLAIFECLNTVRLTGKCNRKVPVKYTAVTVIRYGEQPYVGLRGLSFRLCGPALSFVGCCAFVGFRE